MGPGGRALPVLACAQRGRGRARPRGTRRGVCKPGAGAAMAKGTGRARRPSCASRLARWVGALFLLRPWLARGEGGACRRSWAGVGAAKAEGAGWARCPSCAPGEGRGVQAEWDAAGAGAATAEGTGWGRCPSYAPGLRAEGWGGAGRVGRVNRGRQGRPSLLPPWLARRGGGGEGRGGRCPSCRLGDGRGEEGGCPSYAGLRTEGVGAEMEGGRDERRGPKGGGHVSGTACTKGGAGVSGGGHGNGGRRTCLHPSDGRAHRRGEGEGGGREEGWGKTNEKREKRMCLTENEHVFFLVRFPAPYLLPSPLPPSSSLPPSVRALPSEGCKQVRRPPFPWPPPLTPAPPPLGLSSRRAPPPHRARRQAGRKDGAPLPSPAPPPLPASQGRRRDGPGPPRLRAPRAPLCLRPHPLRASRGRRRGSALTRSPPPWLRQPPPRPIPPARPLPLRGCRRDSEPT
jgi:hypothetical protein